MNEVRKSDEIDPYVLVVDESSLWRNKIGVVLNSAGVEHEAVNSADAATSRLSSGKEPKVTGVITDALKGKYPNVVQAAEQVGATAVIMTRSTMTSVEASRKQIPVFLKKNLEGKMKTEHEQRNNLQELIKFVAPQAKFTK